MDKKLMEFIMAKVTNGFFKDKQKTAILKYKLSLEKITKRDMPLSEVIINWIALGYAEEHRSLYGQND